MKSLFLFLTFLIVSLNSFSQQPPTYARAYLWSIGYRSQETDNIVWNPESVPCDILIRFDEKEVVVYSKTVQRYHIIQKIVNIKNSSIYRMVDSNGVVCNYYVGNLDSGALYISIEYQDISWVYFISIEE